MKASRMSRASLPMLMLVIMLSFHSSVSSLSLGQRVRPHRNSTFQQHRARIGFPYSVPRGGSSTRLESGALVAINTFWKAHPLVAAATVCATKASLADVVAQRSNEKFVLRRTVAFLIYGALYQGMVQELIYNNLYSYLFGTGTNFAVAIKKVLFDAFFHNALICIPMAYAVKAFVFQYPIRKGIQQYIDDVVHHGLLLKYYALWMPVNAMIFTIVPPHLRISVMAVVSFFWMIILSTISSRKRDT